eukprot:g14940.t1
MSLVDYQVTRRIAEGRFGTVFAACHRPTGQEVAIKKIRARKNLPGLDFDPWFKSAERERDVLETVKHCNIIELLEHHVEPDATMAILIYPYLAWDLATVLERKKPLNEGSVKVLLRMLLEVALFPGGSDLEQLCLIFQALGTPDEADWPEVRELPDYSKVQFQHRAPDIPDLGDRSDAAKELVWAFMRLNPVQRISAPQALFHRFFLEGCPASRAEEVLEGREE